MNVGCRVAEPLKNSFGPDVVRRVAWLLTAGWPTDPGGPAPLDEAAFADECLVGFDELELTPRARQIARVMAQFLPSDLGVALAIVKASLSPELAPEVVDSTSSMGSFVYLAHGYLLADWAQHPDIGDHFDAAMAAHYELTQRFTAEFSIRPYLERFDADTLDRLAQWVNDPSEHVRRCVSEGSRPRLPWASRLPAFQHDPTPVLRLLEGLRHDPSEYVRRSVANNLNDIAKDHPHLVLDTAARWWPDASDDERRMIRHALRTLIKAGHPGALAVLGFGADSPAEVAAVRVAPASVQIGGQLRVEIDVCNRSGSLAGALVDIVVHFVKANGSTSPKVFKGAEIALEPSEQRTVTKTISLKQHSTRTHYPGTHAVDALINGTTVTGPSFDVI